MMVACGASVHGRPDSSQPCGGMTGAGAIRSYNQDAVTPTESSTDDR